MKQLNQPAEPKRRRGEEARLDLMSKNPPHGYGAAESAKMDFSDDDRVDEATLNRVLWHSIKGENVPMPTPIRRALPTRMSRLK